MSVKRFTQRERKQHKEANVFACCLLMPREMFLGELESIKKQYPIRSDALVISLLAKKFEVEEWAVVLRLQIINDTPYA